MSSFSLYGQIYLEEDFSSEEFPPEGWTIDNLAEQWSTTLSANAGGTSPEVSFQWVQQITTSRLISPAIDLTSVSLVYLQYSFMYDDYTGEGPAVGVATRSGGGEWITVWEILPEGNVGPQEMVVPISNSDVGQDDFQLCFYLDGNLFNLDYWYIDDIQLSYPREFDIRLFLEGPFLGEKMSTHLNEAGFLPLDQPFNVLPWYYGGAESVVEVPGEQVTDWILVELWQRMGGTVPEFSRVSRKAGFICNDGKVTGTDGISPLAFAVPSDDSLYLWIHHRNHFSVMTSKSVFTSGEIPGFDFSLGPDQALNGKYNLKEGPGQIWMVPAGDGNADGAINQADKYEVWMEQSGMAGYFSGDFNLDGTVDQADLDKFWEPNLNRQQWIPDTSEIPFNCGDTLLDQRDGQKYTTVKIGNQCWMRENLNYMTGTSWCYNNLNSNCETYGRLYTWTTIMDGTPASNQVPSGVQGICPDGWHVPSDPEWCILTKYIDSSINCDTSGYNGIDGATKMKSLWGWSSGGNGTNESGFNALPGGCMGIYHFDDLSLYSYHWSASDDYPGFALLIKLNYGLPKIGRYFSLKNRGYSLRCVND